MKTLILLIIIAASIPAIADDYRDYLIQIPPSTIQDDYDRLDRDKKHHELVELQREQLNLQRKQLNELRYNNNSNHENYRFNVGSGYE